MSTHDVELDVMYTDSERVMANYVLNEYKSTLRELYRHHHGYTFDMTRLERKIELLTLRLTLDRAINRYNKDFPVLPMLSDEEM